MKIQGTVKEILKPETFTSKAGAEYTKQTLLLTHGDPYPEHLPIVFFQDKVSLLKNIAVSQEILVHVNLKSNEYKGSHYPSIQGWKIDTEIEGSTFNKPAKANANEVTDLPF
jgi:hypothetical protein